MSSNRLIYDECAMANQNNVNKNQAFLGRR